MKEKKTRNKFRDMIGDYYLTNKKISKENPNSKGGPWKTNEKVMLAIAVVLGIGILIRFVIF